jgi:lipid-A-disaccharide synthase
MQDDPKLGGKPGFVAQDTQPSALSTQHLSLMIVAGEASGDRHAAHLIDALRASAPESTFEFFGSGGDEMRARGARLLVEARDVAIIGVPEIIRGLGRLYEAFRKLIDAALAERPDAVILVDWPDFNLRLAKKLHRAGLRVIYYISPQVWAWREYRVRQIRRDVDRMLVIFPFEEEFYREHGVEVEFVGHPLVGEIAPATPRDEFFARHDLDPSRELLAVLPGSRRKEIAFNLPPIVGAVEILRRERPGLQYVLPLASTVEQLQVARILAPMADVVRLVERDTHSAVGHADFAVVASGTATLETALLGTPLVVVYRASETNYRLLRPLIRIDTFGMVNLIAGRKIATELIQHDCTPERIATEVLSYLEDPERLAAARRELEEVQQKLASAGDASTRAADAILRFVGER